MALADRVNATFRPVVKSWVMNWLDIVLIGLVVIGALRGFRIGLLGAAVNVVALFMGWLFASQIAHALGLVGGAFGWGTSNMIVAVYVIVMALTVAIVQLAWRIIRSALGVATLGASSLVDRVGGLLLGVVLGGVLAGALILALARLTYFMPSEGGNVRGGLERSLAESAVVRIFVEQTDGLPLNAFGIISPVLEEALEKLESRI